MLRPRKVMAFGGTGGIGWAWGGGGLRCKCEAELGAHCVHGHVLGGHHLLFHERAVLHVELHVDSCSTWSLTTSSFIWISGLMSPKSKSIGRQGRQGSRGARPGSAAPRDWRGGAAGAIWSPISAGAMAATGAAAGRGAAAGAGVCSQAAGGVGARRRAAESARRQEAPWRAGCKRVSGFENSPCSFSF